jgi:hypothetical protein
MTPGLIFDNIIVSSSEHVAEDYADKTWQFKFDEQSRIEELAKPKRKEYAPPFLIPTLKELIEMPQLDPYRESLVQLVDFLELNPIVLYLSLGLVPILIVCSLLFCCGGASSGKAAKEEREEVAREKKTDAVKADDPAAPTLKATPAKAAAAAAAEPTPSPSPRSGRKSAKKAAAEGEIQAEEEEEEGPRTRQRRRA